MMRAFGSGGRLGFIIALSHRCPAIARGHSSLVGLCSGSGGGETLTHSSTGAQTDAQFRPTRRRHVCISTRGWAGDL